MQTLPMLFTITFVETDRTAAVTDHDTRGDSDISVPIFGDAFPDL
nr:hypothetical protein [Candidatus Sigynarchaeum springense]